MPLDDDATPLDAPVNPPSEAADPDLAPGADDDDDEATQDFGKFADLLSSSSRKKKNISGQTIRRGEKDFESHGTRVQQDALEKSRDMMKEVLSYTRVHRSAWVRGWYFPDVWEGAEDETEEEVVAGREKGKAQKGDNPRRPIHARERVVVLEADKGNVISTVGRTVIPIKTKKDDKDPEYIPAAGKLWLLPEEALFLVERGSLDLWWPARSLGELFAAATPFDIPQEESGTPKPAIPPPDDDYELGVPLSLQAAYSLLIGNDGERGKISLQKYQVYNNLKRNGYHVLRAAPIPTSLPDPPAQTLWQWLVSLTALKPTAATPIDPESRPLYGPLVRPGLYHSYNDMFKQLNLTSPTIPASPATPEDPYRVVFHVWKTSTGVPFSKTRPSHPDFFLAVVDAHETNVPTAEQITALLQSTPPAPPPENLKAGNRLYQRLRHGERNVLVAVVDHGLVNYMRFAEGNFESENLVGRWDNQGGGRGGKRGGGRGRGRGRGRGGRR